MKADMLDELEDNTVMSVKVSKNKRKDEGSDQLEIDLENQKK